MSTMDTSTGRPAGPTPALEITTRGAVREAERAYAERKLSDVPGFSHHVVRSVHVVLERAGDPGRDHPCLAEATLDVDGTPVRAHVAAELTTEAVDLLEARLRRQLVQLQDRIRTRHRWTSVMDAHEWRHGAQASARETFYPRPVEERQVLRRKTFAVDRMTVDEAAFDMDLLGHSFYLYLDAATGHPAVLHREDGGDYAVDSAPQLLSEGQAIERLDVGGERFVFFQASRSAPASVLYRRYDGHYGAISAA